MLLCLLDHFFDGLHPGRLVHHGDRVNRRDLLQFGPLEDASSFVHDVAIFEVLCVEKLRAAVSHEVVPSLLVRLLLL